MNKYKYPILAKPSGITLKQHKLNVMSEGALILSLQPHTIKKYYQRTGTDLNHELKTVCEHHDDGKANESWQCPCQKDHENYIAWRERNNHGTFKDYASKEFMNAGRKIRYCGFRHELQFLLLNAEKPLKQQVAIAAHHRKLGFAHKKIWEKQGLLGSWRLIKTESDIKRSFEELVNLQYEYAGLRGLLQLADHRASTKEEGDFIPDFTPFNYIFTFNPKYNVQLLAEQHWKDDILLLKASTGAGKTDAALLWGALQIQNKRADRLVIAMPSRFTSNALAISIAENLSETGLYHSSAWFSKFQEKVDTGDMNKLEAEKTHEFARLLETPITVCTIDHLLMALTLTREEHHLITFNLANSCLVIDEADFYDDFTQANILVLLEVLRYWSVPVLLMSASLPESIVFDCKKCGYNINEIVEDKSDAKRDRFTIKEIRNYSSLDEIEDMLELMLEKGTGIIYANTVDKAYLFYKWFEKRCNPTKSNLLLYHSRFTEPDKKDKEVALIKALGKDAWKKKHARGIAILTQIGEMSINISADFMTSEGCPIDRLIQRAGRMCRFDNVKTGELYIINPHKKGLLNPSPYGNYDLINKRWISCEALSKTLKYLECRTYNTELLNDLLNKVYCKEKKYSAKSLNNAHQLKEYFMNNWLINPIQTSSQEDTRVDLWTARDIIPQGIVYIQKHVSRYFNNHLDFQAWKIYNAIELPAYLIEKGRIQHKIYMLKIQINENEEEICVIKEGFYNKHIGAVFIDESEQLP